MPKKQKIEDIVSAFLSKRVKANKEEEYLQELLVEMIKNNTIPLELLEQIPVHATEVGKTKFDQIYDATMELAFPGYGKNTVIRLTGPLKDLHEKTKIWRAIFPEKYKIAHILIRADSYPEAFARACDYACRLSLRMFKKIPHDLQIKITFMSEKAIRRHLKIRWANRLNKRKRLNLVGREFTSKEISGAKFAAIGHPDDTKFKIAKYMERKDLERILEKNGKIRISEIEHEALIRRRPEIVK